MKRFNKYSRRLPKKQDLINRDIRFPVVMVIGADGPLGEMSPREGVEKAEALGLDLVCISPNATPPICKILDYGKYKFEKSKKDKEIKKNSTTIVLKEVRITPNIGQHDLETKAKNARKFIEEGSKVKVSLKFRGRERAHTEVGEETLMRFFEVIEDIGTMEKRPYSNGRFFDMIIAPDKKKKTSKPKPTSPTKEEPQEETKEETGE